MRTIALVAAKDSADTISATVRALAALTGVDEVWVVDDGSTDATAALAQAAGAQVVRLRENRGKGGALTAGVEATRHATRYLLADADLGATAAGLAPLLAFPQSEFVVGVLPAAGGRGGFGAVKRFARAGISRACGVALEAPLSGQRLVDGEVLRRLTLARRFGVEVGMTIDAVRAGVTVVEVPVEVDHRHTGRSIGGFAHRARQGRDVAAALAPRLTSARQRAIGIVALGVAVVLALSGLSWASGAPQGAELPRANRVVLFAFDHLALDDLGRADLPGLHGLAADGAVGALSVRTTDRRSLDRRGGPERPSAIDAFASLGASARVRGVAAMATDPEVRNPDGMAAARRLAQRDRAAALPGGLGDALRHARKRTALVAGAQIIDRRGAVGFPAAAALADRSGRIDTVDVSPGLVEAASVGQPGLHASVHGFVLAAATNLRSADVLLIDPGETARALQAGGDRVAAIARTDAILAGVRSVLPPRTLLVVFAPTPQGDEWELTPLVIYGDGLKTGTVASSSTRRASLGVITDLAPTVLHALGTEPTTPMTGAVLRRAGGHFNSGRFERLTEDGAVRSRFFLGAAVGYTVAAIFVYLVVIGALLAGLVESWRRGLRLATYAAAAFPFALLVTGAIQHWLHAGGESPAVLVSVCLGLGALAERTRGLNGVYAFAIGSVTVIALDVAVTGPIHTAGLLGYSLQTSGRFYGLPNASFSVFAASLLVVSAAAAGGLNAKSRNRALAGAAVLAVGVVLVAVPWLGNDVGGTLALAPVSVAVAWSFFGRTLDRRAVLVGGAAVVALLVVVLGAEATLGSSTHLARAVGSNATLSTTLRHRWDANVGLLVDQWWGFLVFGFALGALALAGRSVGADELPLGSPLRVAFVGVLGLSLLAFAANDSGPVVSVLCLVVVVPALALRAMDADRLRRSRR